jgi:hypothetical protein
VVTLWYADAYQEGAMRPAARYAILFAVYVSLTSPAYAYIDPGTGSVITTTILGFLGAVAYTVRKYFYRLGDFFRGRKSTGSRNDS